MSDIIVIAICAVICGVDNWVEIEEFGHAKGEWLESLLGLPNGIPSHDTFGRVFAMLDAEQFEACFVIWVQHLLELTQGQQQATDGKTVRRSHERRQKKEPLQLVSAWATESRFLLGRIELAADTNEITAIPELLEMLELSGCIVTIDAIGCQKTIAQQITEGSADYVWVLDVAFREDDIRIRQSHAQHNLATLRRSALNLLRREKSANTCMAAKRKRAGRKTDYLLKVLSR